MWAAVGALAGAVAALVGPELVPFAALLLAYLAAGAGAGFVFGRRRSAALAAEAQVVLCGVHAQYATLALWRLLEGANSAPRPEPQVVPLSPRHTPDVMARVTAAVAAASELPHSSVAR